MFEIECSTKFNLSDYCSALKVPTVFLDRRCHGEDELQRYLATYAGTGGVVVLVLHGSECWTVTAAA